MNPLQITILMIATHTIAYLIGAGVTQRKINRELQQLLDDEEK